MKNIWDLKKNSFNKVNDRVCDIFWVLKEFTFCLMVLERTNLKIAGFWTERHYLFVFYLLEVSLFMSGSIGSLCSQNILLQASRKFLLLMIDQKTLLQGGGGEVGSVHICTLKCAKSKVQWLIVV